MKLTLIKHPLFLLILISVGIISSSLASEADPQFPIVPYPQKVVPGIGRFTFNAQTRIIIPVNRNFQQEASLLNELLPQRLTITPQTTSSAVQNTIRLLKDPSITTEEGYRIEIMTQQVNIYAGKSAGIFRAVESIRQLLPVERSGQAALKKGLHPFKLSFVEGGGGYTLKLKYSKDGSAPVEVPDCWFKR